MKIQLFSLAVSIILAPPAFSQEETRSVLQDTVNLDEVIITGTTIKVNKRNVPMAISVVNNLQITESNESALLPILNGRVPGLFVTERGVMGFGVAANAAGQISIRGIGGSPTTGVLMLIDGHPQFMGIFGHPLPDSYVASDVERVEVIRGPASILYGSNAMGGVINIITKKQTKEGFNGSANLMYGSYNTQKYMASAGYKKNKLSLFASINHDQTDGHRPNSDFSITNGYLKMTYELNDNIQAITDLSLAHFKATDPGPDTINAVPGSSLDITRGYWAFTIDNNYEKYSGTAKIFYNFGEHKISDGFHSTDANYGLNIYESIKLFKGNNITLGADYLTYGGRAENELAMNGQGILFKDTTLYDAGVYSFVQQTIFNKLTLNAGLRLQDHQIYGKEWIPAGGFTFKITGHSTLKASISKGFRSPTIRELYIWNHNENLSPETIMSYETGFLQSFFNQKLKFELTGYIIKGDNLIITVPLVGLQNAGEVFNKGIEFAADAHPVNNLVLNLTYSYINMKNPVYATPKHHLFLSGNYNLRKWQVSSSVQYVNHLDTDPSANISFQNYTLFNSKISYKIWKYAEFFISAENILNQKYENNLYYSMPGITAFGGIKMRF
ncbi:MAG TPA: TonB-dependent receptor [Bacteroidales bacterium]|nr:TonB-dependent receptor [Bacteroidales bacterium]